MTYRFSQIPIEPTTLTPHSALLEEAYNNYADAIFRHCYFRLTNRERAKELMQDTFIKAFEYLKKGQPVENMKAFLYRIANNLVIDDVRKKKEQSLDALNEAGIDFSGTGEGDVTKIIEEQRVLGMMKKLDPKDRELVVLRYVDGFKPQDIADMMDLTANVVSVRLHRALKDLKGFLKQP